MSGRTVRVVVDHRERRSSVAVALAQHPDVGLERRHLPLGDYVVEGRITFERKTAGDFFRSLDDGRLFSQVARLKRSAERPVILLEGCLANLARLEAERLRGALLSLAVAWYVPVVCTPDSNGTADALVLAGRHWLRDRSECWQPPPRAGRRERRHVAVRMLRCIDGIGPAIAARLLDELGSMERIAQAGAEKLARVPGVGAARARRLHEALTTHHKKSHL